MLLSAGRQQIERVHIRFLGDAFSLERASLGDDAPAIDLAAGNHLFELKSRTFPRHQEGERSRPRSDYGWWQLDEDQIYRYEKWAKENDYSLYWIFVLGQMRENVTKRERVTERTILQREIYVLPWDVYQQVGVVPRGGYRNIGLGRLLRTYSFRQREITKGELFVEKSIAPTLESVFWENV